MEKMKVADLMVPVDALETIPENASFYEALIALEKARKDYLDGKNKGKFLLVKNKTGKVVGKLSPFELIRGLEPNYAEVEGKEVADHFGVEYAARTMMDTYYLWQRPFKDLCHKALDIHIKDALKYSPKDQVLDIEDRLDKAFHLFVTGHHDSLFVMKEGHIAGLLIFSDIYDKISQTMKDCGIEAKK